MMAQIPTLILILCTIGLCFGNITPTFQYLISLPELRSLQNEDLLFSFASFAERYNKSYSTRDEVIYRVQVFQQRVDEARKLNEKSERHGKNAATYGITKFSDLTTQEFKDKYLMKNLPKIPTEKLPPYHMEPLSSIEKLNGTQPSSFDWAQTPGTVTPVYNQGTLRKMSSFNFPGSCGSCWAFSATENHESRWARQHNEAAQEMSVQQILDCDEPGQYGKIPTFLRLFIWV